MAEETMEKIDFATLLPHDYHMPVMNLCTHRDRLRSSLRTPR
jgi:hypothetical protein